MLCVLTNSESRAKIWRQYCIKTPCGMTNCPSLGGGHVVADSLFIAAILVCGSCMLGHCYGMQLLMSSLDSQSSIYNI